MNKKEIFIVILVLLVAIAVTFLLKNLTGSIIQETDEFSNILEPHWTHMPLTYSLQISCDKEKIQRAMENIQASANQAVSFSQVKSNADITITCSSINNCYQNKTARKWFWIITTEAICGHESGEAQITKLRGNKILKAGINLITIKEKQSNCTETELHELLHVFNYSHSENPQSIMHPEQADSCIENIDAAIAEDLIKKYQNNLF